MGDDLKKWIPFKKIYLSKNTLKKELNISETMARLLINRDIVNVEDAKKFLSPDIKDLHNPYEMSGMSKTVERIEDAIKNKQKICIYGDYDVDGITSVAMLYSYIKELGGNVTYYIPNRADEGYGLNIEAIDKILSQNVELIITVDCGIRSIEEVEAVNIAGADIIITDHHQCGESLPDAYAIINPNQAGCNYPFKYLAGAGVVFKLIAALSNRFDCDDSAYKFLDLAALATVADVVPLIGENRIIVKNGLEAIKHTTNTGLNALIKICNINLHDLDVYHIGFNIAPRINAAGRLKDAGFVVELFTTDDPKRASEIAEELNELNVSRQSIESAIFESALDRIKKEIDLKRERIIVLENNSWHVGVIGIIASKITERFNVPSIIISLEDKIGKGSARSIAGLNIFEAISKCEEMLIRFGGHEMAAGLTIEEDYIGKFREKINDTIIELQKDKAFYREIFVDYKLDKNDDLRKIYNEVVKLEPFGEGNPKPVFVYRSLWVKDLRTVGKDGKHLHIKLFNEKEYINAIGFNLGYAINYIEVNQKIDIICSVEVNSWNGNDTMQLHIKDFKLSKSQR